jgi:ketosteroid isomerase-like protein
VSQQNVEIVRQRLSSEERSHRTLQERMAVRYPWFLALWARAIARLSPRSRLRQTLLARTVQTGLAAFDRGDIEVVLLAFEPDVELLNPVAHGKDGTLGMEPRYRGHDGYRTFYGDWCSVWGTLRIRPRELIDLGDRFLVTAQMSGRGVGSGISLSQNVAVLTTLNSAGKIIREQRYFDHADALKAVGLED